MNHARAVVSHPGCTAWERRYAVAIATAGMLFAIDESDAREQIRQLIELDANDSALKAGLIKGLEVVLGEHPGPLG